MTPTISTHVLDTETGKPAAGVPVRVGRVLADGAIVAVGGGATEADASSSPAHDSPVEPGGALDQPTLEEPTDG